MIITDINNVPFYFDEKAIIMIRLHGISDIDHQDEPSAEERLKNKVFEMGFYLQFGIVQAVHLDKIKYDELWKAIKDEHI